MAGTQQTVQSYADGGAMKVKIQPAVTNLSVTGAAALSGALSVSLVPQVVTAGEVFQPISAGSLSGTFSTILSLPRPSPSIRPTSRAASS